MFTKRFFLVFAFLITAVCNSIETQNHVPGENPIIRDVFTADPAALIHNETVYLYVGHDVATGNEMFNIPEWLVYSSTDMKTWTSHGTAMRGDDFGWSGGNSWASQVIEKDGKFWFYTTTNHAEIGSDAIGVAVSDSPLGPFVDAIGEPLVVDSMTPTPQDPYDWDDIDPTAFTDDDGSTWIAWGNMHLYLAKLKENMIEIDGEIQELYLPNFTEGPWIHKREDLYYMTYACFAHENMWEKICYATAPEITGPYTYKGIITDRTEKSYTIHPAIIEFKDQWYFFYHTGQLTIGEESGAIGRRAVSIEYLYYNEDGTIKPVKKTKEGLSVPAEKPDEYQPPVFNPNGNLAEIESKLAVRQDFGIAVSEWPMVPGFSTTNTPYQHAINSESFNGEESGNSNAAQIGQSFLIESDIKLEKLMLYAGGGFGIGEHNKVKVALYDLGTNPSDEGYQPGENLLGLDSEVQLNYKPQAPGLYEITIPQENQVILQAGHTYVVEFQGVRGSAPLFWYRTRGDVYAGGAAYRDREIIKDDANSSDFLISVYGASGN